MVNNKRKEYYVADFETEYLTEEQIEIGESTYVWAWAICSVNDSKKVVYGTEITTFFNYLRTLKSGSIVYFHNLKFDGQFILNCLLNNGYSQVKSNRNMKDKQFTALVSELGVWYQIQIKLGTKIINIYDSLKKLPFQVKVIAKSLGYEEEKGKIDYHQHREEGGALSEEDKDYIRRDVQIVANAIKDVCFSKDMYKMTIGSDCMEYYKSITPNFLQMFPKLTPDIDYFCRQAYKGGYCYVNPKIAKTRLYCNGSTYDYNSMYPSVMHSQSGYWYPVGKPEYYTGMYETNKKYPLYIQHFKASFILKDNKVPTVQIKNNKYYNEHMYIEMAQEEVELYMTNVDLERFFDHYEIISFEPIDGLMFNCARGMFDKYINHWYKYKEEATIKKDKVGRMVAKLMLNNLYGKFATGTDATTQQFYYDNGILRHHNDYEEKDGVYVPVGAFITSYARKELIDAIQANYDNFCYCDTDSIHLTVPEAKDIKVHDSALGYWKKESTWTEAKFIRQKTYAEFIDGKWDFKAAGACDEVKENITIDTFNINATFPGKLSVERVKGGIVLQPTTFTILDI